MRPQSGIWGSEIGETEINDFYAHFPSENIEKSLPSIAIVKNQLTCVPFSSQAGERASR